jgi:hypothetical protein
MKITINGQNADIRLETERTVGDILAALEQWLANSGHRLSGMAINGESICSGAVEAAFSRKIDSIAALDITTSSLPELAAESLFNVLEDIGEYENAAFDGKRRYAEQWKESPEALLLAEQFPDLFTWSLKSFSGEGIGPQALRSLIEERLRELQDPAGEIAALEPLITQVCVRLEELPLDIQTGKDSRAAETVGFFSNLAEKVFRIFNVLKTEGFLTAEIRVEDLPVFDYIAEFSAALKELLAAYEQHDTVLVGDLAEYEMAPRLRSLYAAVMGAAKAPAVSA